MKAPLSWLKEYVSTTLSPEALADRLTMAGLEVTGLERLGSETVLDFEITPNRADCLSIIGIAREVAALTGAKLKSPQGTRTSKAPARKTARASSDIMRPTIRIEDPSGCRRYIGRLIDGVRIAPSPPWMQQRLVACGVRPINNVVDITNYVLLEYGQPLHAFDFERLAGGTVLVRRARAQERMTTLDEVARTLTSATLVIADAQRAVALAGVMGGMGSEVTTQTSRVLLESAQFDPMTVRRTSRALALRSESSYRFERGVDPIGVETASTRAAALLESLAGGRECYVVDVGTKPSKTRAILVDPSRAARWLGIPVSAQTIRQALTKLSCRVASSGTQVRVTAPSFRADLTREVDLYEEVARMTGYDKIPSTMPVASLVGARGDGRQRRERSAGNGSFSYKNLQLVRRRCAGLGLSEVISWALVSEAELARAGAPPKDAVALANPLSQDYALIRPTLLIGMLRAVRRNLSQGAPGIRCFEVGNVVRRAATLQEEPWVGLAISGLWIGDWRLKETSDFFRLKGLVETLLRRLCGGTIRMTTTSLAWAEPNHAAVCELDGQKVGVVGQVARSATEALDIEQPVWFGEFSLKRVFAVRHEAGASQTPPAFPPVKRDLSVMLEDTVSFEQVHRALCEAGGALASSIDLVDRYTGDQIPKGKHSLTFSIEYRDPSRTLTASEVDALHTRLSQTLTERFGARLRS